MATPGCSPVPVEKRRYHRRALPIFDRSSKVAMSVNCEALPPSEVADESCKRHKQKYPLSLAPCSHINQSEISLETRKQREGVESCRWHRIRTLFSSNGNIAPVFPLDFINISGSVTLPPFVLSPHSPPAWKLHCADCWVEPARETREGRRNVVYATQKCSLCTANAILAR